MTVIVQEGLFILELFTTATTATCNVAYAFLQADTCPRNTPPQKNEEKTKVEKPCFHINTTTHDSLCFYAEATSM